MKKSILLFTLFLSILVNASAQAPATATAPETAPATTKVGKGAKIKDHANEKGKEHAGHGKGQKEKAHAEGENKMKNDWGLSADQQTQFKAANEAQKAGMQKLMADKTMAKEAKEAQKAQLKADYEAKVKSIFTPEQYTKWQTARDSRAAKPEAKGKKPEAKRAEGKAKGQAKKAEGKVRSDKQAAPAESH